MKIAIITSGTLPVPPVNGGAVENLIDLYLKYNEIHGEHEFIIYSVYSKEAEKAAERYKYAKFIFIKTNSFLYKISKICRYFVNRIPRVYVGNAFVSSIKKKLKTIEFDLFILENCPMYSLSLQSVTNNKMVLHLHNDTLYKGVKLDKNVVNSYHSVFAISEYLSNRVKTIGGTSNVLTLYNGINVKLFDRCLHFDSSRELRRKYNIKDSDVVVLYTGRLDESKGVKHLIEAFKKIKDIPNLKLVIAGAVFYGKEDTNSFVKELFRLSSDIKEKVIFTGYVDYGEIGPLYAMADIGVVPSLCEEGFGLTVLEHMSTGTAIITTNSGAIPEIVDDNCAVILERDHNFTDNLYKAIIMMAKDSELRNKMGAYAKKKSSVFNYDNYTRQFMKLIGELNDKRYE